MGTGRKMGGTKKKERGGERTSNRGVERQEERRGADGRVRIKKGGR